MPILAATPEDRSYPDLGVEIIISPNLEQPASKELDDFPTTRHLVIPLESTPLPSISLPPKTQD
jgi:hypothetical protein